MAEEVEVAAGVVVQAVEGLVEAEEQVAAGAAVRVGERVEEQAGEAEAARVAALEEGHAAGRAAAAGPAWAIHLTTTRRIRR